MSSLLCDPCVNVKRVAACRPNRQASWKRCRGPRAAVSQSNHCGLRLCRFLGRTAAGARHQGCDRQSAAPCGRRTRQDRPAGMWENGLLVSLSEWSAPALRRARAARTHATGDSPRLDLMAARRQVAHCRSCNTEAELELAPLCGLGQPLARGHSVFVGAAATTPDDGSLRSGPAAYPAAAVSSPAGSGGRTGAGRSPASVSSPPRPRVRSGRWTPARSGLPAAAAARSG